MPPNMRRQPNFIIVMADDLGYGDLGCNGGTIIKTPALDQMSREGVRFTDFYASANVCTPSRAGLLTGRYAVRAGLAHEVLQPADTTGLPLDAPTIPRTLGDAYASAIVGKWHLGHVAPHWPPTVFGFDHFVGLPYSHDMRPLAMYAADGAEVTLTEAKPDFSKLTDRFFAETLAFAEANRERPFFILLALTAPHIPLRPNSGDLTGSAAGAYGEVVEEIDRSMGRLFERLQDLGLEQETLVAFTSDNGPWFEGSAAPFRDRTGGMGGEGGFRVPFIVRQPGVVPAGVTTGALASNLDLAPTLARMAGVAAPEAELDGVDLTDVILDDAPSGRDEVVLFNNAAVVAVRAGKWKYVARSYYRIYDVPLDRYPLLFDLEQDPGESYSLAALHPDIATEMAARLARARAKYDPIAASFPPHVAPASAGVHRD